MSVVAMRVGMGAVVQFMPQAQHAGGAFEQQDGQQGRQRAEQDKNYARGHVEGNGLAQDKQRQKGGQSGLEEKTTEAVTGEVVWMAMK